MESSSPTTIVDYEGQDFRQYWQSPSKMILHQTELSIIRELLPRGDGWFVDIGAGYGRLLPAYRSSERKSVLVDYSVKHLQMVEFTAGRTGVELVAADACRLPFRTSAFSGAVCLRLLHHLDRPEELAAELFRVLAPGSRAIVSFMNKRSLLRLLRYGPRCFGRDHQLLWPTQFGTHPVHFRRIFENAGLDISRQRGAGFLHQVVTTAPMIERIVGWSNLSAAAGTWIENAFDRVFGKLGLALMQYALVKKGPGPKMESAPERGFGTLLTCPCCRSEQLEESGTGHRCASCGREFKKIGAIHDFRILDKEQ
jgi:SAM-dependent methyltransferase